MKRFFSVLVLCIGFSFLFGRAPVKVAGDEVPFKVIPLHVRISFEDTDTSMSYANAIAQDFLHIAERPFKWKGKDWARLGGLAVITGSLFYYEETVYKDVHLFTDKVSPAYSKYFFEPLGDTKNQVIGLAAIYGTAYLCKSEEAMVVSQLTFESLLLTGVATNFMKYVSGRSRPQDYKPYKAHVWDGLGGNSSFWSGHTATVFSMASVVGAIYKDDLWVGITAYSLAGLAGLARIADDKHWTSDVVVGAAVGTVIGQMVVKNYRNRTVKFTPILSSNYSGFSLQCAF